MLTKVGDGLEKQSANTVADSIVSIATMDPLSIGLGGKIRLNEKLFGY
jgi:hypothetical protein